MPVRINSEAVPYDLAALYAARFEAYDPYLIFLHVLWERYAGGDYLRELLQEAKLGAALGGERGARKHH